MRRFEALVMSQTEPVQPGTLWLRKKHNDIGPKPNEVPPVGMSIWWFGERGWQPLYDLDTRYNLSSDYSYEESESPIDTVVTPKPEVGVVNITNTYSIYNGSRDLSDTTSFVNETGLKKHVDDLQSQIDILEARVETLESKVATIESSLGTLADSVNSALDSLNARVSALENQS